MIGAYLNLTHLSKYATHCSLAVLSLGLLITSVVLYNKQKIDQKLQLTELEQKAKIRAKDIQAEFKRSHYQVASVANLFTSTREIERSQFDEFVEHVFTSFPQGRRISYIKRLPIEQYPAFIESLRQSDDPFVQKLEVFDYIEQQAVLPATPTEGALFFPMYSFPTSNNPTLLGRNIKLSSPIGPLLFKAYRLKKPWVSNISRPIPIRNQPFFIHLHPITSAKSDGLAEITGFIISSHFLADLFKVVSEADITELFEYEVMDSAGNRFVYPQNQFISRDQVIASSDRFSFVVPLVLENNLWQIRLYPKQAALRSSLNMVIWIAMAGVLTSLVLAVLTRVLLSYQASLLQQVEAKTQALNVAIDNLDKQNTDLQLAVTRSEQAAKVKSEFLANMSHEIRTPLNGIVGFTQLMRVKALDPTMLDYVGKMEMSAKHLMTVINDILDFSKIESGQIDLEQAPFSIHSVVDYLNATFEQVAKDKGIDFVIELAPDFHPDLMGDIVRINQVALNLCSNAVKFTSAGRVVVALSMQPLSFSEELYQVSLKVSDTGIGMNQEQLGRLFQAFTQADTSTTRRFGGTGLGLTISQRLCNFMGGQIWVESEQGVGSTFTAQIQIKQNRKVVEGCDVKHTFSREARILIVDDNAYSRQVVSEHLQSMGASTVICDSVSSAMIRLKAQPGEFEVLVLDWSMPTDDGAEMLVQLSDLSLPSAPKVVVLTAYNITTIENTITHARSLIHTVLQKPCKEAELFEVVEQCLQDKSTSVKSNQTTELNDLSVLVVEDNEINQVIAKQLLESLGVTVFVAGDGQQALQALDNNSTIDLVLMDIQMPVMDGITATLRIREHSDSRIAKLPVIALTANVMSEDIDKYLATGINSHIAKPFDIANLQATIVEVLTAHAV